MNERWFEEFGKALDTLYHVMRNADDNVEMSIEESYYALKDVYQEIGEQYGYTGKE